MTLKQFLETIQVDILEVTIENNTHYNKFWKEDIPEELLNETFISLKDISKNSITVGITGEGEI